MASSSDLNASAKPFISETLLKVSGIEDQTTAAIQCFNDKKFKEAALGALLTHESLRPAAEACQGCVKSVDALSKHSGLDPEQIKQFKRAQTPIRLITRFQKALDLVKSGICPIFTCVSGEICSKHWTGSPLTHSGFTKERRACRDNSETLQGVDFAGEIQKIDQLVTVVNSKKTVGDIKNLIVALETLVTAISQQFFYIQEQHELIERNITAYKIIADCQRNWKTATTLQNQLMELFPGYKGFEPPAKNVSRA
jgi:hypothetical protein